MCNLAGGYAMQNRGQNGSPAAQIGVRRPARQQGGVIGSSTAAGSAAAARWRQWQRQLAGSGSLPTVWRRRQRRAARGQRDGVGLGRGRRCSATAHRRGGDEDTGGDSDSGGKENN